MESSNEQKRRNNVEVENKNNQIIQLEQTVKSVSNEVIKVLHVRSGGAVV